MITLFLYITYKILLYINTNQLSIIVCRIMFTVYSFGLSFIFNISYSNKYPIYAHHILFDILYKQHGYYQA